MNKPSAFRRVLVYCIGVFVLALGVSTSIYSGLGVSANSSVPYAVSLTSGIDNGICSAIVFSLLVGVQALVLGRDFSPVQLLQVPASILFGSFVSVAGRLLTVFPQPAALPAKLTVSAIGVFLVGTGIFIYMSAGLVPMSAEGLSSALSKKLNLPFTKVKLVTDCAMAAISAAISLIFTHELKSVGIGTVMAAVLVSPVIALMLRLFGARLGAFMRYDSGLVARHADKHETAESALELAAE